MKKLILLFTLLPLFAIAQNKGTHFEHGLSWQQVKEKAKKENKYLFVDCFTTWCGPCKHMAKAIFPQEKVGDFFNKNFVNVKVQFDKTKDDSEEVKKWYADAEAIAKKFEINAYPTFLVFSPQGQLVHKIIGGGDADVFIAKVQKALSPETQYYTLLAKEKTARLSPENLMDLANAARDAYEEENALKYTDAYLATQKDLSTKTNLGFLSTRIVDSKSKGFEVFLKNPEKVDALFGKGVAQRVFENIIYGEVYSKFDTTNDIDSLITATVSKYPSVDIRERTSLYKIYFYVHRKNWDHYGNAVLSYMSRYGAEAEANLLNYFAWGVFENCNDADLITDALKWSKRSVDETQGKNAKYLNTYANLLYKLDRKEDAIAVQQQALNQVQEMEKNAYQLTLEQMKKGL